jgi:hypothetical protein
MGGRAVVLHLLQLCAFFGVLYKVKKGTSLCLWPRPPAHPSLRPSVCDVVSALEMVVEFRRSCRASCSCLQSDTRTWRKGVNGFVPVNSILRDGYGWNLVAIEDPHSCDFHENQLCERRTVLEDVNEQYPCLVRFPFGLGTVRYRRCMSSRSDWVVGVQCKCAQINQYSLWDKGKGKDFPLQAWTGPWVSRRLRLQNF